MKSELIDQLKALMVGRSDGYLQEGRGCVKEPLTDEVLLEHLHGRRRIGAYSLLPNGSEPGAKFLTLDFDGKNLSGGRDEALKLANRGTEALERIGLPSYLEVSRSKTGYHLWVFFGSSHAGLSQTQDLGRLVKEIAELPEQTEVFPKGQPSDPYGGTPFMPLWGFLKGERTRNVFVDSEGKPLPDQQALLQDIQCVDPSQVDRAIREAKAILGEHSNQKREEWVPVSDSNEPGWVVQALAGVEKGERNKTLTRLAGYFRKKVPLDIALAILEPFGGRCSPALPAQEIVRTVAGVYQRYGEVGGIASSAHSPGEDDETPLPEIPESCWRPGFAQFREAYTASTEASDAFLFGGYLVVTGLVLGRNASLDSGVEVYPNTYTTNVGASGRTRKSTAQGYARRLLERVAPEVEHSLGIGSPEGLLQLFCGQEGTPRRVLIDLNETASLLRKGAQEGTRGLLPFLATLYDCPPSARLPNRSDDLKADLPFLSVYGSTTAEWFCSALSLDDVRGGLAGRFLYITGKEKSPIPFPPPPNLKALAEAEGILSKVKADHQGPKRYGLSQEAHRVWSEWYIAERAREYPTLILEVLAQRLHLHAWKLALVFAAIERSLEINEEQVRAACAFADYQRAIQGAVFGGLEDSAAVKTDRRILAALKRHGPLAGWELQQKVRHLDAETLARRLAALARLGAIEERPRGRGKAWHLLGGQG